jgi:hypothetical protein
MFTRMMGRRFRWRRLTAMIVGKKYSIRLMMKTMMPMMLLKNQPGSKFIYDSFTDRLPQLYYCPSLL